MALTKTRLLKHDFPVHGCYRAPPLHVEDPTPPENIRTKNVGFVSELQTHPNLYWETDFYTPPVLGGAALLPFSAPAVYKNPVP